MNSLRTNIFSIALAFVFGLAFSSTALATCSVTCAAICRYTCEFEVWGSCSDSVADRKIQQCCSGAFANTPGINDVPCSTMPILN